MPVSDEEGRFSNVAEVLFVMHLPKVQQKLKDRKTKEDKVWQRVVAKMGIEFPDSVTEVARGSKCREKYNNIQATYLKYKRSNNKTGEARKKPPKYVSFMEERLSLSVKVNPNIIDSLPSSATSSSGSPSDVGEETEGLKRFEPKPKRSKHGEMLKFMREKQTAEANDGDVAERIGVILLILRLKFRKPSLALYLT